MVDDNVPAQTAQSTTQNVKIDPQFRTIDQINTNPLDGYIDVIYNVSLGLVSWNGVQQLQKATPTAKLNLGSSDVITFASTADAKTSVNYTGDYYNIKKFTFTNFCGHLPQNPMVAVIWDGKMKIVQPYGFSFREDLDQMAQQLKYPLTTPLNFVYRLEIWFSGYKPTGEWVSNIPIPISEKKPQGSSIVYYISITTVEARVTSIGTEYDLSFQTASHLAQRAEMIMMHQDNVGAIKDGPTVNYAKGSSFADFIKHLSEAMHNQVLADTQSQINVDYQFYGPTWLFNDTFIEPGKVDFSHGVSFNPSTGTYAFSGKNVDMLTLLNHVMDQLVLVRQLHLQESDKEFVNPGCLWTIRTNISQVSGENEQTNNYKNYTFQYIIEPVISYRSRMTEWPDRNTKVEFQNQKTRAQNMLNYGMMVRTYDYLFTEDNSEIIDFEFSFKMFYYESFPYPSMVNPTMVGVGSNTPNDPFTQVSTNTNTTPQAQTPNIVLQGGQNGIQLSQIVGFPVPDQSGSDQFTPPTKFGAISRAPNMPAAQYTHSNESNSIKYHNSKDQYMRYDMINAQITVRFDPTWLLNPYMEGGDFTGSITGNEQKDGIFVYAHTDKVVYIKAYRPNQKNYMNPNFSNVSPTREPIIGGYYQVIQALNEFEGGRFVQKLNMFKYPHMNYFNSSVTGSDSSTGTVQSGASSPTASTAPSSGATQPDPQAGQPLNPPT